MKDSQNGFVVPLLIAIIALLVVGGGVYVYQNNRTEVLSLDLGMDIWFPQASKGVERIFII